MSVSNSQKRINEIKQKVYNYESELEEIETALLKNPKCVDFEHKNMSAQLVA
jgi:hypothetical protein